MKTHTSTLFSGVEVPFSSQVTSLNLLPAKIQVLIISELHLPKLTTHPRFGPSNTTFCVYHMFFVPLLQFLINTFC